MTKSLQENYYQVHSHEERLTADELLFFKKELESKKEKIEKNLELSSQEFKYIDAGCPKDEGDHASMSSTNSTTTAILKEQGKTLKQINNCLHKITLGTYGVCAMCEETIDIERLKVKIFAEYCISCREIIEKQ